MKLLLALAFLAPAGVSIANDSYAPVGSSKLPDKYVVYRSVGQGVVIAHVVGAEKEFLLVTPCGQQDVYTLNYSDVIGQTAETCDSLPQLP